MERTTHLIAEICGLVLTAALVAIPQAAWSGDGGAIAGKITFKGEVPAPEKIPINKDQEVCGEGQRIVDEVRMGKDGSLEDVVVFIDGKIDGAAVPDGETFELLQKGCRFNPFVLTVPKGSELSIVNGDPVAHNIHAYELLGRARRDLFNFQQPNLGHTKKQKLKPRRSNIVQLQCDIHDFMRGWIVVPKNPFFGAVEKGEYELTGIPAGERTVVAFHPVLGTLEKKVTVADGGKITADFEFTAK